MSSITQRSTQVVRKNFRQFVSLGTTWIRQHGTGHEGDGERKTPKMRQPTTPIGRLDDKWEAGNEQMQPIDEEAAYAPFPENQNPETGEIGGPRGPEPTRYGDWERKGRVIDF